uniref:Uncharacterized protein n=1 Tax=Arundo donax TaxID=35708 RepID=A0A0A9H7E1_ARUDO
MSFIDLRLPTFFLTFYLFSAAACAYIVKKLFEVTPTGPSQGPLDLLLLREGNLSQRRCSSCVIIGRIIFSILGIFMAAVVTYTVITDGLPFRKELLTPSAGRHEGQSKAASPVYSPCRINAPGYPFSPSLARSNPRTAARQRDLVVLPTRNAVLQTGPNIQSTHLSNTSSSHHTA